MSLLFLANCILLDIGLSRDDFSLSIASRLAEHGMGCRRMIGIAEVFGGFQFLMPLIDWGCVFFYSGFLCRAGNVHPLGGLLSTLGLLMSRDGLTGSEEITFLRKGFTGLLIMGVATSIDALSEGFAIAGYDGAYALVARSSSGTLRFACACLGSAPGNNAA
ncbi:MAG: manganese efflux pump [Dialister sp.]|nr:manganese efflux pump [Dialister sp.]